MVDDEVEEGGGKVFSLSMSSSANTNDVEEDVFFVEFVGDEIVSFDNNNISLLESKPSSIYEQRKAIVDRTILLKKQKKIKKLGKIQ
jgi:hypothetical protein